MRAWVKSGGVLLFMGLIWFRLLGRRASDRSKTWVRFPPAPPFFTDLSMSKTAPIPILDRTVKKCGSADDLLGMAVAVTAKAHIYRYGTDSQSGVGNHSFCCGPEHVPKRLDFSPSFAIISLCPKNTV